MLNRGILNYFLYSWLEDEAKCYEQIADEHISTSINKVITTLTAREEKMLRLIFGLDDGIKLTRREIAERYGVGMEKIRRIEQKAMIRMKHHMRKDYFRRNIVAVLIEETILKAWNKIICGPDSLLVALLSDTTKKLCGYKPLAYDIAQFLKNNETQFFLSSWEKAPIKDIAIINTVPAINGLRKITQDELIPHIISVLKDFGGVATKMQVEEIIYQKFEYIFKEPYYNETVSHGVARWRHNVAWAKERAKKKGLIERPEFSGRGYWKLTETGNLTNYKILLP